MRRDMRVVRRLETHWKHLGESVTREAMFDRYKGLECLESVDCCDRSAVDELRHSSTHAR